jgi:hypothetical protein
MKLMNIGTKLMIGGAAVLAVGGIFKLGNMILGKNEEPVQVEEETKTEEAEA